MSEARTHTVNINKAVLDDFDKVEAGLVRRSKDTGKDMRRGGGTNPTPGQMGSKMRKYEAAGLCELTDDLNDAGHRLWKMTAFGEAERQKAIAEYKSRRV